MQLQAALADISNRPSVLQASKPLPISNRTTKLENFTDNLTIQEKSYSAADLECLIDLSNHRQIKTVAGDFRPNATTQRPAATDGIKLQKTQGNLLVPTRKRSKRTALQQALPGTPPATVEQTVQSPPVAMHTTTPLAAEVLTGLSLGTLANVAVDIAENGTPELSLPNRLLSSMHASAYSQSHSERSEDMSISHNSQRQQNSLSTEPPYAKSRLVPREAAAKAATAAVSGLARAGPMSRPQAHPKDSERKGCNCKRSMCLKLYCECFAAGGFCVPGCACTNCYNHAAEAEAVQQARQIVLSKDSKAFEKKVTASEGHKRGCRCKRSKCQKKYCECFHAGAKCNPDVCQCEGCENTEEGCAGHSSRAASPESLLSVEAPTLSALQVPGKVYIEPNNLKSNTAKQQSALLEDKLSSRLAQQTSTSRAIPIAQTSVAAPGFQLSAFQQPRLYNTTSTAPIFWGHHGTMMPGIFQPFLFNHAAQYLVNQIATVEPQLPALQQLLLPIAPLQGAWGVPVEANDSASQRVGSHSNLEQSLSQQEITTLGDPGQSSEDMQMLGVKLTNGTTTTAQEEQQSSVALTAHLSECQVQTEHDVYDTATSPAPRAAPKAKPIARATMTSKRPLQDRAGGKDCTEGGTSKGVRLDSKNVTPACSAGSDVSYQAKRPKRAASSGVVGAVAAEAAAWGDEFVSPPKRASSVPVTGITNRSKAAGRFALLRKALEAETLHAQTRAQGFTKAPTSIKHIDMAADEQEVISALFELSSSTIPLHDAAIIDGLH